MPPMLTDEDLSMRHLPEVSDYSFSFQIPMTSLARGDDLMADDNTFLEGTNGLSALATPVPPARALSRPPTRVLQAFTPRLSTLESSPQSQQSRTSLPSDTSYGHAESPSSPITEAHISSKDPGNSEAEGASKEERKHEHQDQEVQEQDPCMSESTTSSAMLDDILDPPHLFAKRSPLGSQPEVGHSEVDLPQTESLPRTDSAGMAVTKEQQRNANLKVSHRSHLGRKPLSTENTRLIAGARGPKKPTVIGGVLRSRNMKKATTTKSEKRQLNSSLPAITSHAVHKRPLQADKPMGTSTADESLDSNSSLPIFVSNEGAAGRLVMHSQRLMNLQNDGPGPITHDTEPNCILEQRTTQLGEQEGQDVDMNLDDRQHPCSGRDTHATDPRDQEDDLDKPLTISQLSPRKPSAALSSVMEQQDNSPASVPPPFPVMGPISRASGKKRQAPVASVPCRDQPARKRGRTSPNAVSVKARSGLTIHVPVYPIASTSSGPQSLVASAASSVLSELGSSGSGAGVESPNVIVEKDGGRKEANEENVVDAEHAKTKLSSELISTSGCESSSGIADSGPSKRSKQVVKRPVEIGTRSRTRRTARLSSSTSGGRTSRTRSFSNSVTRADVLLAKERGKRLAQIRTRKEGCAKDKLGKSGRSKDDSGDAEGSQMSASASETKPSDMTYPISSTYPVEFKFASDLRIQARKREGHRMTRSTLSLSSSSGGTNTHPHLIPDFKAIHSHFDASQAHRKENVHPVIPQPFHWATDERIKERKEFDEMVKAKEREKETLQEQKRKEREEEEEREMRELRKRAVPKANAVPEWYKDAPKRKKDEETISR